MARVLRTNVRTLMLLVLFIGVTSISFVAFLANPPSTLIPPGDIIAENSLAPVTVIMPNGVHVQSNNLNFMPSSITVTVGVDNSIVWKNEDSVDHSATSNPGDPTGFDTGLVSSGTTSGIITLTMPGTYLYHCKIHPAWMQGKIVVVLPAPTTTTTTTMSSTHTSLKITSSTTTTSTSTTTSSTLVATKLSAITLSPQITGTISATTTSTGSVSTTITTEFTQIQSTKTSTSRTTFSTSTKTVTQTTIKMSTSSSSATSASTTFKTTTSSGTLKVTETDIFTHFVNRVIQVIRQLTDKLIEAFRVGTRTVKTPVGRVVHRVIVVK